jgi:hypothetical protein
MISIVQRTVPSRKACWTLARMFEFCFIRLESSCCRLDGGVVGSRNLSASSCHDDVDVVDDEEVLSDLAVVVVVASSAGPLVNLLCCCCTNAAADCSDKKTAAMIIVRLDDDDGATILLGLLCPDRISKTKEKVNKERP